MHYVPNEVPSSFKHFIFSAVLKKKKKNTFSLPPSLPQSSVIRNVNSGERCLHKYKISKNKKL